MAENEDRTPPVPLGEAEAREILNKRIPPEILAEYGGFVHAYLVRMADGRGVCLIRLERGYFLQFSRNPEDATARGLREEVAVYLSPEAMFACATLYALFGDTGLDEETFWRMIDPAQGEELLGILRDAQRADAGGEADALADGLDIQNVLTCLLLVEAETSATITEAFVAGLSPEQREQAVNWAVAVHLKASDNEGVEIPPRPAFLPPPGWVAEVGVIANCMRCRGLAHPGKPCPDEGDAEEAAGMEGV